MSFIRKIQQKSRSTRLLILWLASFLVMAIIILIWLFSFSKNLGFKEAGKEVEKTGLPSLFESLGKDFSIFKQGLEANLKEVNQLEEELEQDVGQEK